MSTSLTGRHFLKEIDFSPVEFTYLLDLAAELKAAKKNGTEQPQLEGREIALTFEKTSTRTRAAFEVAGYDQGAHVTFLDPDSSQMGHKESIPDTARVLGRMYDGIEYRGSAQAVIEQLAEYAGVPVFNGLTDEWHPTQMLADFLTMHEHSGKPYPDLSFAFMGDLRFNMGRSELVTAALLGSDVAMVGPKEMFPPNDVQEIAADLAAASGSKITITDDLDAVAGVDFIHTDVWVSMGEPKSVWQDRVNTFRDYQVNDALFERTGNSQAKFMHCLPAFHDATTTVGKDIIEHTGMTEGLEVTHNVFESERSIVFDQAENRLHTIKAILVATLG